MAFVFHLICITIYFLLENANIVLTYKNMISALSNPKGTGALNRQGTTSVQVCNSTPYLMILVLKPVVIDPSGVQPFLKSLHRSWKLSTHAKSLENVL
jgi:hypothetical protein